MTDAEPNRPVSPIFAQRIRQALAKQSRRSLAALAESSGISRHTLKKIEEGGDARLWLSQITQFDEHIGEYGLQLIAKDPMLAALARQPSTTFILPGYRQDGRRWSSTWDVMASSHIRSQIEGVSPDHRFEMRSVAQDADMSEALEGIGASNIVCIGSPRAMNVSSEFLLRLLFPDGEVARSALPFRFFWSTNPPDSPFAIRAEAVQHPELKHEIDTRGDQAAWAIIVGDDVYLSRRNVSHHTSRFTGYGIACAAFVSGFVHSVYCGLSGPDSEALGRCTRNLHHFVEKPTRESARSPVVWYLIESTIEGPENPTEQQGDLRRLIDQKVISGPNYWEPVASNNDGS